MTLLFSILKNKKLLIGLAGILVVAIAAGYWYYQYYQKSHKVTEADAIEQAGNSAENLAKQAAQGVLPEIDPQSNPMEDAPDINPISKTNPFSGVKTNPFK